MKTKKISQQHVEILASYDIVNLDWANARVNEYVSGETIIQELFPIDSIMFVLSGTAKVFLSSGDGEDVILAYYISAGIIGDAELMSSSNTAGTTLVAVTDFVCIALPFKHYAKSLKNNVLFLNRVGAELANKLVRSSKNVVMHSLYSGEQRLCAYILETAKDEYFNDRLTDVAKSIGSSYRNMLRTIKKLCDRKIIEKIKGGYKIINRNALLKIAPETMYEL